MQKVELVARTTEVGRLCTADPESLNRDMVLLGGKAAGVCYMPDDYFEEGIQNEEKAVTRAGNCKGSGHHSALEHGNLTFVIKTNKIMAMVLNSISTYVTSEKSGRYTKMTGNTEIEIDLYNKWNEIFKNIITGYYKDYKTEKEIEKLAQENARYMLDVFYPTSMEYTIAYRELSYFICHLQDLIDSPADKVNINQTFWERFVKSAKELIDAFKEAVFTDDELLIRDVKGGSIRFLDKYINEDYDVLDSYPSIVADSYSLLYRASFAEIAQAQRHRTLRYTIFDICAGDYYIPAIIRNTPYEKQWVEDLDRLTNTGLLPSATTLLINETGIIDDFVMKCKERLCSRAQLEICEVTSHCVEFMYKTAIKSNGMMSKHGIKLLQDMVDERGKALPRCAFTGYVCHEPCKSGRDGLMRNI